MKTKRFVATLFWMALIASMPAYALEKIILVNEGMWQTDNGRLTYFEDGVVRSNQWYRDVNGRKLGDTPSDIIQINDNLIAIAVNWSNLIQFINPQGRAVGATEDIPNNRKLATDGNYIYATSYAHEVRVNGEYKTFEKGYVAKIDANALKVVSATEVGYEPEGVACYMGHIFVANSGGYSFQENHDYETTVSVINTSTMETVRTIDTGQINLYGRMSQSGQYLCINSPGDYYSVDAATIILDCRAALDGKPDSECFYKLDYAASANCVDKDGNFYAIGSRFSYYTGEYEYNHVIINPAKVFESAGQSGVSYDFPGTVRADIEAMSMPYAVYVNPYTGYIYAADSGEYSSSGYMYQWNPSGQRLGKHKVYINPAYFLALPPDGKFESVDNILIEDTPNDCKIYNLQGICIEHPVSGEIYISNGKKVIFNN